MKKAYLGLMAFALLVSACATSASAPATPTITVIPVTATIPVSATSSIKGHLYGHGAVGVILSNQSDNIEGEWGDFPKQMAAQGYMVFTYSYSITTHNQDKLDNLQAAISWIKQQGAKKVVLVGASLGGIVTSKAAAKTPVNVMITLSSPLAYEDLVVGPDDLKAIAAPKLFINDYDDDYAGDTQAAYTLAPQPKTLKMYDGSAHGVVIFVEHPEVVSLILKFLASNGCAP